ncbi:MCE family protein [Acidiferrimicrobium sp. IK]|uniref:MCE family protein n=1 Tax=Acidiferrimicrobium sp. IK TaxID=2871700 RepID=UPI0021CAF36E|nr:MlaD family protein [Acidiferrimicrobium sp. IK]MCU4186137.1 MCE family protein [Acidiferrimicrobium sp. IK]
MSKALAGIVVKLAVFTAASLVLTAVVVASLLDLDTSPTHRYKALFTNASSLQNGDPVRVAGVKVGRVSSVSLRGNDALVSFTLDTSQQLRTTSQAQIEFENLFGQRNLTLTAGSGGGPLPPGSTIPVSRTQPALDLTDLFNGFQPLFQALTPADINQLTANIIGAFQGQSTNISGLVTETARLTNNLADRSQIIDQVVSNLNTLLTTVAGHDTQVGQFIDSFASLAGNLAGERGLISSAISSASTLTGGLSGLTGQIQPSLQSSITDLTGVTAAIAANQTSLDGLLRTTGGTLTSLSGTLQNGTYAKFYLCNLTVNPAKPLPLTLVDLSTLINGLTGAGGALPAPVASLLTNLTGSLAPVTNGINLPHGPLGDPSQHTPNCQ